MCYTINDVCSMLTGGLHTWVGALRNLGAAPNEDAWIEKLAIFFALEDCQEVLHRNPSHRPIYCRFSMTDSSDSEEDKKKLREMLKKAREVRLKERLKKTAARTLQEFMLDFSLSKYSIPQALGTAADVLAECRFEMLLIAESEMHEAAKEVFYDLLKLTCVPARLKVMLFKARPDGACKEGLLAGIETVLRNARRQDDSAEWTFLGIPGYREWISSWEEPDGLPHSLHALNRQNGKLENKTDWWSWNK